jgi:alpha-mannosidase
MIAFESENLHLDMQRKIEIFIGKYLSSFSSFVFSYFIALSVVLGQISTKPESPDLTKQPRLYVVAYSHLDTQWRWEYPQTINEFLPGTMHDNFALFEKYPHYIFNFSGANRYRLMKEYWPDDYARLKQYVAAGRWFPAGSSMEEGDVNSPSGESIIRQILYGTQYFRHEFGKTSAEYMLPDCFGFPASLPSILAHMGIKGFSTQKLSPRWQPGARVGGPNSIEKTPEGIPFNIGFWEGPDGRGVVAALNPGRYNGNVLYDLSKSSAAVSDPNTRDPQIDWPKRIQLNGEASGLFTDYHYYGIGDRGGAPREASVKLMEAIVTKGLAVLPPPPQFPGQSQQSSGTTTGPLVRVGDGPVGVISSTAEQIFLDIFKTGQVTRLPRYKGDLELINHSAGSISSQTYQKRWNRKNELLADAAERASVAAMWLGAREYPLERLNGAWTLLMGGQFHDILPGTATPKAFEFSWNDEVVAMNQFAAVVTSASEGISSGMDTRTKGMAIVIYNPLNISREDVVEATISFPDGVPTAVRVFDPEGKEVAAQINGSDKEELKILFLAKAPSVGYAVYDIQLAESSTLASTLRVSESSLENERYRIRLDRNGDVESIFDKSVSRELLSAPARLAFQTEVPHDYPAWNMDWADQQKPPRGYVHGPAKVRIVENGPVRVALEIERETEGSRFVQTIRLSSGDGGNRVEFSNIIDWKAEAAALKATFPLTAANSQATYNMDIGTIQRANNDERKYEVPSHQWFDLTDKSGTYGVTVLSDCKNASDKPDDNTLRLTLLYTPGLGEGETKDFHDQSSQDWGHHEFIYGLASHAGDWRQEQTDWQAQRLNQPLIAFESPKHPGWLGKNLSFLNVNNSRVRVLALKKAEESDELIMRLIELDGEPQQNVRIAFAAPITSAREVNGQEQPLGAATVKNGELVTNFGPYQPRTFALKLAAPRSKLAAPEFQEIALHYDLAVSSLHHTRSTSGFDSIGRSLPDEMLPREISYDGIRFNLARSGRPNAVVARGQTISLPPGRFTRLYLLAASADGDQRATFYIGNSAVDLTIQNWLGFIGQWDNRRWKQSEVQILASTPPPSIPRELTAHVQKPATKIDPYAELVGITPGFIKRDPVAWFASHHHRTDGVSEPYAYSYLFAYVLDVPANAKTLTLPNNEKIRILAITLSSEGERVRPVQPLCDVLGVAVSSQQ